jgi:hypothetical protein
MEPLPMKKAKQKIQNCLTDKLIEFDTWGDNKLVLPSYTRQQTVSILFLTEQPFVQFSTCQKIPPRMEFELQRQILDLINRMNTTTEFGTYLMDTVKDEVRFSQATPVEAIGSFDLLKFMTSLCQSFQPVTEGMMIIESGGRGYEAYKAVTGRT